MRHSNQTTIRNQADEYAQIIGLWLSHFALTSFSYGAESADVNVTRLAGGPIITPDMDDRMGGNIQGPSLIKVPDWVDNPLGKYYLYFADHRGTYIRMAYADEVTGPWTIHTPGTLKLEDSFFHHLPALLAGTVLPPVPAYCFTDVLVREDLEQIVMYYHGRGVGRQFTRAAVSSDGIRFEGREEDLGRAYFRVIEYEGYYYAMSMPGVLYRSRDGLTGFEADRSSLLQTCVTLPC